MNKGSIDISYAMNLKPKDAIAYFESKGRKISFAWQDVWQEAHAKSFTVAGMAKADLLADVQAHVSRAIKDGRTTKMFAEDITPLLKQKGWWGEVEVTNPKTGEVRKTKVTPSRVALIHRQNVSGAYNAGRYKQQRDNREAQPYWMYDAVLDQKTRPAHAALDGSIFSADDRFWDSHYPPNGFGCRCKVTALSERGFQKMGGTLTESKGRMTTREVEVKNTLTGKMEKRTVSGFNMDGVKGGREFFTDVGFSYNPGKAYYKDVLAHVPSIAQKQGTTWKELGFASFRDMPEKDKLPAPKLLPRAQSRADAENTLASVLGFKEGQELQEIRTPVGTRTIWRVSLAHMVAKEADGRERYAHYVKEALENPHEIWLKEHEDGKLRENYVCLFQDSKDGILAVVRINRDGSLFWNFMQRSTKIMDKLREGWIIFKKS